MSKFVIRPALPQDVPTVHALIRELAEFEQLSHWVVSTEEDIAQALFGANSTVEIVLGREGDITVAFALFFHNYSTFLGRRGLYLEDLYVREAYRRRGYGRALLVHLAQLAKERGCGRFEWAVLDWNTDAIAFYESLGATVLPDWRLTRLTGAALDQLAMQPLFMSASSSE